MTMTELEIIGENNSKTIEGVLRDSIISNKKASLTAFTGILILAEILSVTDPIWGVVLHSFTLALTLFYSAIMVRFSPDISKLFAVLLPVPLIRIVSVSSPLLEFTMVEWFLIISIMLFSSILISLRLTGLSISEYGFKLPERKYYPLETSIIMIGIGFGMVEYLILTPEPISREITMLGIIPPLVGLYFSTGLLEELLFRGLIQKHSSDCLGTFYGIVFTTLIFMIMHTGWQSFLDIVFVGVVGAIYSVIVYRTGSIVGVSFSHAMVNISLFVISPELIG